MPDTCLSIGMPYRLAPEKGVVRHAIWEMAERHNISHAQRMDRAQRQERSSRALWLGMIRLDPIHGAQWGTLTPRPLSRCVPWAVPGVQDEHLASPWGKTTATERHYASTRAALTVTELAYGQGWGEQAQLDRPLTSPWGGYYPTDRQFVRGSGSQGLQVYGHVDQYPSIPTPEIIEPEEVPTVPALEVYLIMHSASITDSQGNPLEFDSIHLSFDLDAWAWQFSASTRHPATLAAIRPGASGNQEIHVTLDGHNWHLLVEEYSGQRQFANSAWSVSGRGLSAELAAPYRDPLTFTEPAAKTAAQLAEQEVAQYGWTMSFDARTTLNWPINGGWLVPGGAYSYSHLTPIQAVAWIGEAIGARIVPDRAARNLALVARYPISPWSWASATPDLSMGLDMVTRWQSQWIAKPDHNGVYVRGQNQGVNCFVKRAGTDGAKLAQEAVHPLITHQDAGRELGRQLIADSGLQEHITLELPLMPAASPPGLLEPGALLEVTGDGDPWRALVVSVAIAATFNSGLVIHQTITLERHHGHS